MTDPFPVGCRVRTPAVDPPHHTRVPRYARGAVGTVLEPTGRYPLADDRARGLPAEQGTVYTVVFRAVDLFGEGDHRVALDLWEQYLQRVEDQ